MRNGLSGFQPQRLTEARDARGLTQVALSELVNRTSSAISRWEKGEQLPEMDAVDSLSEKLNVPVSFFLREQPEHGQAPLFFRSMVSTTQTLRRRTCARMRWTQDISLSLQKWLDLPRVDVPQLSVTDFRQINDEDIERMAAECRQRWGLGIGPISDLLLVLENAGISVIKEEVGSTTMDGLSNWSAADGRPYILIAKDKDTCVRSRLDAAHELGHLVLHKNLREVDLKSPDAFKEIERQAFQFAGAFLLPAESFMTEVWSPSLNTFQALKPRWKVSIGAMVKRAAQLDMITPDTERLFWKYYGARGWRKREPLDEALAPEEPRLLSRSVRLLIDERVVSKGDLLEEFRLSSSDIESLCGLPRGYFKSSDGEVLVMPQLKNRTSNEDRDITGTVVQFPVSNRNDN